MDWISKRRNGEVNCLNCKSVGSELCLICKNWDKFEIEEKTLKMTYEERYDRVTKLKGD